MKSAFCFALLCCLAFTDARAQYYYQDIVNAQNTMAEHASYVSQRVRHVRIRSFDANHDLNQQFLCTRELSDDFRRVVTRTSSFETGRSAIISDFDAQGRIRSTLDSSAESVNTTTYFYDSAQTQRIDSILFVSYATKYIDTFRYDEKHIFHYDSSGRLTEIIRLKNKAPFSAITISTDSLGQVTKEAEKGKYDNAPPVYYKHNADHLLTDIFHYNAKAGKMEPDYLFDYDAKGRLSAKTVVTMNTNGYLLWQYAYDDKGLITSETCYGKKHALQGTMEFSYTY